MNKVLGNIKFFTVSAVLQKVVSLGFFIYLARSTTPQFFGQYNYALFFGSLLIIGVDLGLDVLVIRESAQNISKLQKKLAALITLKILSLVLIWVLFLVSIWVFAWSLGSLKIIVIALAINSADSFANFFYAPLRGLQKVTAETIGTLLFYTLGVLLGVFLFLQTKEPLVFLASLLFSSILHLIYSFVNLKRSVLFKFRFDLNLKVWKYFAKLIPDFALTNIFVRIFSTIDVVLLGWWVTTEVVSWYVIPLKVLGSLTILIPGPMIKALYPALSEAYLNGPRQLAALMQKTFLYLFALSLPASLGLYLTADKFVNLLWPQYPETILGLKVVALVFPIFFTSMVTYAYLNANHHQAKVLLNRGVVLLFSLILNLSLLPIYGFKAVLITMALSNLFLLSLDVYVIKNFSVYLPNRAQSLQLLLSIGGLWLVISVLNQFSLVVIVLGSGLFYFLSLSFFKILPWQVWKVGG